MSVKTMLMAKGERIALIVAGVFMLLLAIVGILNMTPPDTAKDIKEIEANTKRIVDTVNGTKGTPDPYDPRAGRVYVQNPVSAGESNRLFFDPNNPPDSRRVNPVVLRIAQIQADFTHAKVLAYDIREEPDGSRAIGVLKFIARKTDQPRDKSEVNRVFNELSNRFRQPKKASRSNPNPNPAPPPVGPMGLAKGLPPAATKAGAMPKKVETKPAVDQGPRMGVEYVPIDAEKIDEKRPALTIYPQRMVVVQASFPYKAQLEVIQKALHLEKLQDVLTVEDAAPVFQGIVVERQVDGKEWLPLNFEDRYRETIFPRTVGDREEDPLVQKYAMFVPAEQKLVLPLPWLVTGNYPPMNLSSIMTMIRNFQAANKSVTELPKTPSRYKGEGNIFGGTKPSSLAAQGQATAGTDINIPKAPKLVNIQSKDKDKEAAEADIPDYCLIRFIDNDIEPGHQYRYRVKTRMVNPNWVGEKNKDGVPQKKQKYDLVSRPSDADIEIIEGSETIETDPVSVPREDYLFATDPEPKEGKKPALQPGQAVLQYQRWLPTALVGNYSEPVADWIVADVVVRRGGYAGGKQFVNLPLWSSEYNRYILRDMPHEKGAKKDSPPRRGVMMDPSPPHPQYAVVEVEGGVVDSKTATGKVKEETAAEILLLDEDGNLSVRSTAADRRDPERGQREVAWRQWVDKTDKETPANASSGSSAQPTKFD